MFRPKVFDLIHEPFPNRLEGQKAIGHRLRYSFAAATFSESIGCEFGEGLTATMQATTGWPWQLVEEICLAPLRPSAKTKCLDRVTCWEIRISKSSLKGFEEHYNLLTGTTKG
jgi:hypothetical protein